MCTSICGTRSEIKMSLLASTRKIGTTPTDPVKIEQGLISGVYNDDQSVQLFAGIPYAAPPTGPLRWAKPEAPAAWEGVRSANRFSGDSSNRPSLQNTRSACKSR
jgi:carboxylesterase type B